MFELMVAAFNCNEKPSVRLYLLYDLSAVHEIIYTHQCVLRQSEKHTGVYYFMKSLRCINNGLSVLDTSIARQPAKKAEPFYLSKEGLRKQA